MKKKKVYLIINILKYLDNGQCDCRCMYCGTPKIRDYLFNVELKFAYGTHYKMWCQYHGKDSNNENAWHEYLTVVDPSRGHYSYQTRLMTKEEIKRIGSTFFSRKTFKKFKKDYEAGRIKF